MEGARPTQATRIIGGYANVLATLALFVALGGTALATHPGGNNTIDSGDIVKDQVRSSDVRDDSLGGGGLKASDLRANSVAGNEVADATLAGADFDFESLGGTEIDEASLAQVPSALLGGFGRTGAETVCDPESAAFISCAGTEVLTVPPGARALVFGHAVAFSEFDADFGVGNCRLSASSVGGGIPNTTVFFHVFDEVSQPELGTLAGITPPLNPGATSFGIECNQETGGAIQYFDVQASVVLIAAD